MQNNNFKPRCWTVDEDAILRSLYGKIPPCELSDKLNRTDSSIRARASKIGLHLNRRWTHEEDELLKLKYDSISVNDIAKMLNRTHDAIENRAFFLCVKKSNLYWTQEEDDALKSMYNSGESIKVMCETLHRTYSAIDNHACKLGIRRANCKHVYDRSYFHNVTDESAYWAGFIAADGCINKNHLTIQLAISDYAHVDKFRECVGYDLPTTVRNVPGMTMVDGKFIYTGKIIQVAVLSLHSKEMVSDLLRIYNITPKKSLTLQPPNIVCTRHMLAYIVGLLDGDGTIYYRDIPYKQLELRWLGTNSLVCWINDFIGSIVPGKSSICKYDYQSVSRYGIFGKRALKFINYISLLDIPKMERKWSIVEKYR